MQRLGEDAQEEPIRQATTLLRAHFPDAAALDWGEVKRFVSDRAPEARAAGLETAKNFNVYMISAWSLRPGFPNAFAEAQRILQPAMDPDVKANKLYRWTMDELNKEGK
jgi:hypothetical protein